jgi:hypothetical protein
MNDHFISSSSCGIQQFCKLTGIKKFHRPTDVGIVWVDKLHCSQLYHFVLLYVLRWLPLLVTLWLIWLLQVSGWSDCIDYNICFSCFFCNVISLTKWKTCLPCDRSTNLFVEPSVPQDALVAFLKKKFFLISVAQSMQQLCCGLVFCFTSLRSPITNCWPTAVECEIVLCEYRL